MKIIPTEEELGKDEYPQSLVTELFLMREAFLQSEMKLSSLEHVLYNQMWDEEYIPRLANRNLCTEITKLREHVNKKFYYLDRKILRIKLYKNMDESEDPIYESEDPGLDEIIN